MRLAGRRGLLAGLVLAGLLSCKGDSPTEAPGPISLTLSPSSVALAGPGDTVSVVASVTEVGGGAVSSASLTWTSDNKAVAEVSSTGRVTAIASGTAGITVEALSNGRTATQTLTVTVGSAVLAGAGGGAVSLAAGVDLVIPAGALPGQVFMTAKAATGLPTQPAAIPGTAFEFGPDGVVFSAPVTLTVRYDPAVVPAGVPESELRLHKLLDGGYVLQDAGAVDVVAHEVSAEIHGFSVYAVVRRLQVTTDGLPAGTQAVDYGTRTLAVAGGNGSYEWSVASGSLPTGLSLGTNGVISGTPSIAGTFDFVVRVVSGGQVAEKAFSITVHATLLLTTTSLPSGVTAGPYSQQLTATGGSGARLWEVTAGTLPGGLTLDSSTGVIAGSPALGSSAFTVRVTSGDGQTARGL